jgi:ATP-dependent DNA helicase RecQ
MHERFLNDIDDPDLWHRKRQMTVDLFQLLESGRCRHQAILAHFDEDMPRCGSSCDTCSGVGPAELAAEGMASMGDVRKGSKAKKRAVPAGRALTEEEESLFLRLKELRKELADRQRVPAYIVFSDKVLMEMAMRRPGTDAELLAVAGVGPAKLEKYGPAFLAALRS